MLGLAVPLSGYNNRTMQPPKIDLERLKFENNVDDNISEMATLGTPEPTFDLFKELNFPNAGTLIVHTEYGTMKVTLISVEEEIRRVTNAMNKKQRRFTYYSFVWSLCTASFGVFVSSLFSGLFDVFVSLTAIIMTTTIAVGAFIDWKDWLKKNAY